MPPSATRTVASPVAGPDFVASSPASTSSPPPVAVQPAATPDASPGAIPLRIVRSDLHLVSARSRAVAFISGSTILICGGLTTAGTTTGSIERIDLRSGLVAAVGTLSTPVHDAAAGVLGESGFVFGGGRLVAGTLVQRVDPSGQTITVGQLPAVRADLSAVAVDGDLLIVGGGTPSKPDTRVLATSDGGHFRTIARLLVGVRYPAVAVFGGLVYVIGGSTTARDTDLIQTIDPRTGVVRIAGRLARPLSHAAALVVGDALLLAGGRGTGRAEDGVWRFDTTSATMTRIGRLPYPVSDAAAIVLAGVGYLIGGEAHHPIDTIITLVPG